jgi:hypothetical protein
VKSAIPVVAAAATMTAAVGQTKTMLPTAVLDALLN